MLAIRMNGTLTFMLLTASLGNATFAAESTEPEETAVDFDREIAPIFETHCLECHSDDQREGGLRLDQRRFALVSSDSGNRAIVPGSPEQSELLHRISTDDTALRMPLDADRLPDREVARITKWISQGAPWPAETERIKHWAYRSPIRPPLPETEFDWAKIDWAKIDWAKIDRAKIDRAKIDRAKIDWAKNEVDCFIAAKLAEHGWAPSEPADPARLIRRLHLDLIGLPPSPEAVDAFVAAPTDRAYEIIVDELLASPRYGEKWARSWLDLARYSDSNGYQADQLRDLWAYRDWVIAAMNNDMPFDQFTIEQIAGDLLPEATQSQIIATGFHRTPTCNVEAGVDPEANRTDQVIDRVNTTGTVWLGTTIECAQCHNHKYDPFTQREYYQLFAFFNNTPLEVKNAANPNGVQFDFYGPKLELPMSETQIERRERLSAKVEAAGAKLSVREEEALAQLAKWEAAYRTAGSDQNDDLPQNVRQALSKPTEQRNENERQRIVKQYLSQQPDVAAAQKQLDKLISQRDAIQPDSTLVMVEMAEPRTTNVFLRGQFLNPGEAVRPGVPQLLHDLPQTDRPNRLALARWLVSRDNPLVARVTVNRWWYEVFGRGLVTTIEDFGAQGEMPSHPALLDWLAVEFMENGWSMKHMQRLLVTSATYRQSSRITAEQLQADPANQWYSRGPRNRMPAEMIRDHALAISGLLTHRLGGKPVYPPQPAGLWNQTGRNEPVYATHRDAERYRRGIYVIWRRAAPYPSFVNFDAPDRMTCVVKRPETNTPLQALTLLNDQAFVEAAQAFAAEILTNNALITDKDRVALAFRKCVARDATAAELGILLTELTAARDQTPEDEAIEKSTDSLLFTLPKEVNRREWWAWFSVANVLLNLDETITK